MEQFNVVWDILMDRLWQALIHRFGYYVGITKSSKGGRGWRELLEKAVGEECV